MSRLSGTVLWYRPTNDRGSVKADTGKRLFFSGGLSVDAVAGLRVVFRVEPPPAGGPPEAVGLELEHGRRDILDPSEYLPQPKVKKKAAATKKKSTSRKRAATPPKLKKAPGAAMATGTPVNHPDYGAGHVVSSTKTFVRVEFLSGVERSVPFAEIEDVSGNRGTPAPKRRRRSPAPEPEKPAGRTHMTRRKSNDA